MKIGVKEEMESKFKCGIEIHTQLYGMKSKLFCACPTSGNEEPNTRVCEICTGMPGSKPVLNQEALNQAIKVALALNCKISRETYFSRKSYFYVDLSKNYQITQYELPLATSGELENIRIKRLHLEEDPAALVHKSNYVLIDYNRSGIPLIEIVTEPDFTSPNQVRKFLRKLITILEYLNIYSRKTEATMKADLNISTTGPRVEIKNITGLKEVERALDYEILRQKEEPPQEQETRSWDPEKSKTFLLRKKETEEDYGYIIESDLTKIEISDIQLQKLKKEIPELPESRISRFIKEFNIPKEDAETLASEIKLAELFELVAKKVDPKLAASLLRRDLISVLNYEKLTLKEVNIKPQHVIELLQLFKERKITDNIVKDLLIKLIKEPFSPLEYVKKEKLETIADTSSLEQYCKAAIKENPKAIQDYKSGKEEALNFLIGLIIKKTKGTSDPNKVRELLKSLIN